MTLSNKTKTFLPPNFKKIYFLKQAIPVIMIGPGTGCSPFRSYINDQRCQTTGSERDLYLYFGCRNRSHDFFFSDEWLSLEQKGRLHLSCAFSRDQPDKM
jgi:sulfite reductase alpha subunit-like flavoprotein